MLLQTERAPPRGGGTQPRTRTCSAPSGHFQHHARLMDSPTLARVERAMLRHEPGTNRAEYAQSLLHCSKESTHAIKRGLMWQQRDKLFSRWKERYFILTRDYLHCFRRASGADRISEMGQFLFKVKLVDVERVNWENKKTYSAVALVTGRDATIYLRTADGLEEWFELLEECTASSKERRRALRHSHDGKQTNNDRSNACFDDWLAARQKLPTGRLLPSDVTKAEVTYRRRKEDDWDQSALDNRLSRVLKAASRKKRKWYLTKKIPLLTDIDVGAYDDSTLGATSVTSSYRIRRDVTCVPSDSFRSGRGRASHDGAAPTNDVYIKFRERSYSDIQRIERKPRI